MLMLHMKQILTKSSQHFSEFPIVYMNWYGWIQSSAMIKQQDVRWCGFRWSIAISIDYVWSVYIHGAISTPWYSYCIWNSYIKNHHWLLAWYGKQSLMQDCTEKLFYTVIIDISMVVENVKILGIAEKSYIYIIHVTYLYSYSITTLYHSVVSKNLFVFSMFDYIYIYKYKYI